MKPIDEVRLTEIVGGARMSADTCGAALMSAYAFAMVGFYGGAIFCAAVYLGGGCA